MGTAISIASRQGNAPDWGALFGVAQAQSGYFTTGQAAEAGYSPQLLQKYLGNGKVARVMRGIYRLVHFPAGEQEELVWLWLWAEQAGVFSHETALALYDLSDVLPSIVHMIIPVSWRHRRLRVPQGLVLHYADLRDIDRAQFSVVPVTSPRRTLRDCIESNVFPDLVRQGVLQARRRGLISERDSGELNAALERASEGTS
ncbi:MAG TPA: type IV toxin-antitoxin system AbiEi family antitoxin domain-containing protein [Thermoanaerobaculia bacterium]|jgi:predicted transcriptional regulator of viral defense system|nr:type IV toxin-antitoxin system AbiEi family antitoxin domain-containing protein [Thermoanaerobaculia bacterium]